MSDVSVGPAEPSAGAPPAVPILSASPAARGILTASVRRLTAIEIRNYRAYRGVFRLELPRGENLLVYGENGAGKSSLFYSLRTFLEAPTLRVTEVTETNARTTRPLRITDHQHRFTSATPGIELEFGEDKFEWTDTTNDTGATAVRLLNQAKGFLDYKALLEIYYLRADEDEEIDLFPLMMRSLLPYYTYTPPGGKSVTYLDGLRRLQTEAKKSASPEWRREQKRKEHQKSLDAYNEALERTVIDLASRASDMLEGFGDNFKVSFRFAKATYKKRPKRVEAPRILAVPAFRRQEFQDYHNFFNEAKLSAMAICLFLAALKESPATGLRLLALDDILIGLDMTNRVKVIDLVRDHFHDWQTIILTYSKAWFERLKEHVKAPEWKSSWRSVVLCEEWRDDDTSPYIIAEGSGDLLEMAAHHLKRKDYKAAAVYARSALEALCHRTCARASLFVLHVDSPKDRKVEHFWNVLSRRISEIIDDGRRAQALLLIARLEQAREFVLNRNAHFDVEEEDTLSGEVGAAIETVHALTDFFQQQPWAHENFQTGRQLSPFEEMNAQIAAARAGVATGATRLCRGAMASAFECFWLVFGAKIGLLVPLGARLSPAVLWEEAEKQGRLTAEVEGRLKAARPYLFGSVKGKDFDNTEFERAAKVMEELLVPPVAAPATPPI